ncbi:ATP-dependent DNA ligase [Microbacterium sp. NPDC091313]
MGKLTFENSIKVEFEDRLLAHLEHVITAKLRRGESFTLSWKEDVSVGGGRVTVWLHPHVNIVYKFHGGRSPRLNPAWLQALTYTANGPHGLYAVPEPDDAVARRMQQKPAMVFREVPVDAQVPADAG